MNLNNILVPEKYHSLVYKCIMRDFFKQFQITHMIIIIDNNDIKIIMMIKMMIMIMIFLDWRIG